MPRGTALVCRHQVPAITYCGPAEYTYVLSPRRTLLVQVRSDGARVYDVLTGQLLVTAKGQIPWWTLQFSPSDQRFAWFGKGATAVYDTEQRVKLFEDQTNAIAVQFSTDGEKLGYLIAPAKNRYELIVRDSRREWRCHARRFRRSFRSNTRTSIGQPRRLCPAEVQRL